MTLLPSLTKALESLGRNELLYTNSLFALLPVSLSFVLDGHGGYKSVEVEKDFVKLEGLKYKKKVEDGETPVFLPKFKDMPPGHVPDQKMAFLLSSFVFVSSEAVNEFLDDVSYSVETNRESFGESFARSLLSTIKEIRFDRPYLGLRRLAYDYPYLSSAIELCTDAAIRSLGGLDDLPGLDYEELLNGFEGVRGEVEREVLDKLKYMIRYYEEDQDSTYTLRLYDRSIFPTDGKVLGGFWLKEDNVLGVNCFFDSEEVAYGESLYVFLKHFKEYLRSRYHEYEEIVNITPKYQFSLNVNTAGIHEYQDIFLVPFDVFQSSGTLRVDFLVFIKNKTRDIDLFSSSIELSEELENRYLRMDYEGIVTRMGEVITPNFRCEYRVSNYHDLFSDPVVGSDVEGLGEMGNRANRIKKLSTSVVGNIMVDIQVPQEWSEEELAGEPKSKFRSISFIKSLKRVYCAQFSLDENLSPSVLGGASLVKTFDSPILVNSFEFDISHDNPYGNEYYNTFNYRIDVGKMRSIFIDGIERVVGTLKRISASLKEVEGSFANMIVSLANEVKAIINIKKMTNSTWKTIHSIKNIRDVLLYSVTFWGHWILKEGAVPESKTVLSKIFQPESFGNEVLEAERRINIGYGRELCKSFKSDGAEDKVKFYPLNRLSGGKHFDGMVLSYASKLLSDKVRYDLLSRKELSGVDPDPLYLTSLYLSSVSLSSLFLLEKDYQAFLYPSETHSLVNRLAEVILRTFVGGLDHKSYYHIFPRLISSSYNNLVGPIINLRKALEKFIGLVIHFEVDDYFEASVLTNRGKDGETSGSEASIKFSRKPGGRKARDVKVYLAFPTRDGKVVLLRTYPFY